MLCLITIEEEWEEKINGKSMKMVRKFYKLICFPFRKTLYESFGLHSDIIRPLLIVGKKYIHIGDHVFIRDLSRIEAISSHNGKDYSPQLYIADEVTIEQGVHLTCTKKLIIKKGVTISSYVYISDTAHGIEEMGISVLETELHSAAVTIGEYAFIGTGVKIMPGVTIGKNCVIGANSVVTKDIPDYCMAVGAPARVIKKYNMNEKRWEALNGTSDN